MSMTAIGGPLSMRPCAATTPAAGPTPTPAPTLPSPARWGGVGRRRVRGASFKVAPPREAAWRRLLQRFAAARQAWIGHEIFVGIEGLLAGGGGDARGRA